MLNGSYLNSMLSSIIVSRCNRIRKFSEVVLCTAKKGIQAYKKDSIKSDLASADPHRVIQLLMHGAIETV